MSFECLLNEYRRFRDNERHFRYLTYFYNLNHLMIFMSTWEQMIDNAVSIDFVILAFYWNVNILNKPDMKIRLSQILSFCFCLDGNPVYCKSLLLLWFVFKEVIHFYYCEVFMNEIDQYKIISQVFSHLWISKRSTLQFSFN